MTPLIPALGGALVVGGALLAIAGARPAPVDTAPSRPRRPGLLTRLTTISRRTKILLAAGLAAGVLVAALTGWLIAVLLLPLATVGLPVLLSASPAAAEITKLEALEEWTRALASQLTAGISLE